MTFTITYASNAFVVHVADRLVSRGNAPIDGESNKTVIFLGKDGGGVISYTGAARLGTAYTDDVIASAIVGEDASAAMAQSSIRTGGSPNIPDVGQIVLRIAGNLRRTADAARISGDVLPRFVVAGHKWRLQSPTLIRSIEPFMWVGMRRSGRGTYGMAHKPWTSHRGLRVSRANG